MEEGLKRIVEEELEEDVEERKGKGKLVMVAVDGSEFGNKALRWGLENVVMRRAEENDDDSDEFVLLHIQQIPPANCNLGVTTQDVIDAIKHQEEETMVEILDSAKKLCGEHNVKVRALVKTGDPRDHICNMVEKLKADLLIMGNRRHGAIKRFLLGSTSDYCVHHAKCNVVIAKDD